MCGDGYARDIESFESAIVQYTYMVQEHCDFPFSKVYENFDENDVKRELDKKDPDGSIRRRLFNDIMTDDSLKEW